MVDFDAVNILILTCVCGVCCVEQRTTFLVVSAVFVCGRGRNCINYSALPSQNSLYMVHDVEKIYIGLFTSAGVCV